MACILYARKELHQFNEQYKEEIQHLMGSVIFIKNLARKIKAKQREDDGQEGDSHNENPIVNYYKEMLSEKHWINLEDRFVKDYCIQHKMSQESVMLITT